jgi:hypothetical protein
MLRASGWCPHANLRDVCKLPESHTIQPLNPISKRPLSLIVAIGAQNAFVLRQDLRSERVLGVTLICAAS